jgi:hypothetical protein
MTNPADSSVQNLLPVQAYFNANGSFNTFIGQGQPFYATANPSQSGLTITNSTLNSSPIGNTSPSTGVFTNIATTTGTISTAPTGSTDIANKQYVDFYAAGLSWKQPALTATSANITLSGLQTINGVTLVVGDVVLVKNQTTSSQNGIYVASAGAWTYSVGGDTWSEYVGAIIFITNGSLAGTAWYCTAQPGGTLGTTAMTWSNFSVASSYTAGTGLTLTGTVFSITPVGTASTYGSATQTPVFTTNASGQVSSVTNTTITPAVGSITGLGTGVATALAAGVTGSGNIVLATSPTLITPALGTPTSGNFSTGTFTWPTFNQNTTGTASKATNLVGGAAGSLPYQSAVDTTTFLAAGTNGQVLRLTSGLPSWGADYVGTVTSVSGTGTVNGITLTGTVTSSGSLTLGGTLGGIANSQLTNSSITFGATAAALGTTVSALNAVSIGATTRSSGDFTTLSANTVTSTTPVLSFNASNTIASFGSTTANAFNQLVIQNKSGTSGASTNYVISNDLGTDSTYYGEFGMNSSVFSSGTPADFFSLNNGVYFSSHDGDVTVGSGNGFKTYLAWGTAGQSAHVINASGAIGLNTSITGSTNFGTSGQVLTSAGSAATPTWTTPTAGITITDDTTTNATRYLAFTSATSGSIAGANVSSTKLAFNPSTGNLGIGTSSPSVKLQISADGGAGDSAQLFRITDTNTANSVGPYTLTFGNINHYAAYPTMAMAGTNGISFCVGDGSDFATQRKAILNSSGYLGIGTSNPITQLQVYGAGSGTFGAYNDPFIIQGTTYSFMQIKGVNNIAGVLYNTNGSTGWYQGTNNSGNYHLSPLASINQTGVTDAKDGARGFTMDATGNLFINRVSALTNEKLAVWSETSSTIAITAVGGPANGNYESSDTGHAAYWTFGRDNALTGNYQFAYNGTLKGTINYSTGTYTALSDSRAKKDITDLTYGLNEVMAMRPVTYLMKEEEDTAKKHLGFIAQEMKAIIDESVDDLVDEEKQMYGLDKGGLVPVLVKAIQELNAKITALEEQVINLGTK